MMRQVIALGLLLLQLHAGAAFAQNGKADGHARGVRYQVAIEGVEDKRLADLLRSVSVSAEHAGDPAPSVFHLRARVKADVPRLRDALKSQGSFAAQVAASLDEAASPVLVRFTVSSAEPFLLKQADVELAEGAVPPRFPLPQGADLGLTPGSPAISKDIVTGADNLINILLNAGHPFPALVRQRVVADFKTRGVQVIYVVNPGPRATFGPVTFSGLKDVEESLLLPLVPWKEGDEFKQDLVGQFQNRLLDLGLFATVAVAPEKTLDAQGRAPVAATVTERKHRTVKAGVNYNTDDGPGANVLWEHRNLFGRAEKLRLSMVVSQISQTLEATFEKPYFLHPRQKLLAAFKASGENTEAYRGQNATLQAGLSRAFTEHVSANAGFGFRTSQIEEDAANPQENDKRWGLAFVPLELTWNTRNDPLDASEGWLLGVKAAPYMDTLGHDLGFLKAELGATTYLKLISKPSLILAVRAAAGAINGAQAKDVPPDVRFYAGGSATVRGYAYQTVGPLRGTKPLGGNSIFHFGSELRVQLTELLGMVVFLDGGNVFDRQYPAFDEGLLYGAGLGLRVTSPVGPLRVDVATPLNPREKVDSPFQLYISLGQAF